MTKIKLTKHIHLYKRINLTPKWHKIKNPEKEPFLVLRCQKPTCNHYVRVDLALGKLAECSRCNDPFILDKITVNHASPHCTDCIKSKKKPQIDAITDMLDRLGNV